MAEVEKSIEVEAPVSQVYNQWTQFEEFPAFMDGVVEVRQLDDRRLFWRARVGGSEKEWEAVITDQTPDTRIAWKSVAGAANAGAVLFEPISPTRTRITLKLQYEPDGAVETVGDALGVLSRRVEGDLERFCDFIEERGVATGGWRGEIHGQSVERH